MIGAQLGVYRIRARLGAGAMGVVYLAEHVLLHRPCALKVLSAEAVARDPQYLERFVEEGRAAAGLVHPNIVTVHAIGEQDGHYFLEMELLAGGTLQQLVAPAGGRDARHAASLVLRIAEGLATAHAHEVVHRDLKPENVLLTPEGTPKIADFGLAKRVAGADARLMGTPSFMAPELFRGEAAGKRSDVYALGVTLYLLLTGRLPYDARELPELIRRVMHDPLPAVEELPALLHACLESLLARDPGARPAHAGDAAALLGDALARERDLGALLGEAFSDRQHVEWRRDDRRWQLQLAFPDGRGQTVYVEPEDDRVLIYSVCCHATPAHHEFALRLNAELQHGALAIRAVDGVDEFVMLDTYPLATIDVEGVRRSVLEVAHRADEVERKLTGRDVH